MVINKKLFVYQGQYSDKPSFFDDYLMNDDSYKFLGVAQILVDTDNLLSLSQLCAIQLSERLEALESEYSEKRAALIDEHNEIHSGW